MRITRAKSGSAPRAFCRTYNKVTRRAFIRFLIELEKLIITAAVTGGEYVSKAITPYVPSSTVEEIVAEVAVCVAAGASVVHLHAKDKSTGEARSILGLK